jgi:hypothetical protein
MAVKAMVEIDKGVGRPDFYPKLFAGHEIAGTLQQRRKHTQGLALQAQLYTAFPEFTGAQIQLKNVETQHARGNRPGHVKFPKLGRA